jgi:flavodoxin
MISIENREAFSKAEAKARQIKPRVSIAPNAPFGVYTVTGSQGKDYTATFKKHEGHWVASCTCPAHVADGRRDYVPKPCYHLPAAYNAFRLHIKMRQEIRASIENPAWPPVTAANTEIEQPPPMCECGKPGYTAHEGRWYCIDCIKGALRDGLESLSELDEARQWEKDQEAAEAEADKDAYEEMMERFRTEVFG